jgi:hypothetical protein
VTDHPSTDWLSLRIVRLALTAKLKDVFGRDFENERNRNHAIGQLLSDLEEAHNKSDLQRCALVISQLEMHLKHLAEIKTTSDATFRRFRTRVLKATSVDDFEAIRFEIDVAASLARRNEPFRKTERPDFTLSIDGQVLGLECTSVHLTTSRKDDVSYKLSAKIREKSKQPHCKGSTALFIDSTAYLHRAVASQTELARDELRTLLQDELTRAPFGSVLLWSYILIPQQRSSTLELAYIREDSPVIEPSLQRLLNRLYPVAPFERPEIVVPLVG